MIDGDAAFGALAILDLLLGLFTDAGKETFTREEVLLILNWAKNDPEIFSPDLVAAYEESVCGVGEVEG
jgi:hypothetical protein